MLKPVLRLLIVVAVAVIAFAQYERRSGMFFPERYPEGMWDTQGLAIQPAEQWITTSDGVRLHGWLFRARSGSPIPAPTLIWFHGNGGNITERASVAVQLAGRGISVLLFDWRGYGRSEGSPSESRLYLDALATYDFTRTQIGATPDTIVLYGESLGGAYAAYTASKREARCVIIENSFPSLRELGNYLYRPFPLGWIAPFALTTVKWLNAAGLPVLVMHGKRDQVIPFSLGQRLFDELRTPKTMLVSESAGHGGIPDAEGARYYDAVTQFIAEAGQAPSH